MADSKKVRGERDEKSAKFGFDKWELEEPINLLGVLYKIGAKTEQIILQSSERLIREALELASKEYECWAWLAAESYHGHEPMDDPTKIFVELPLGPNDSDSPRWSFTMSELVTRMIECREKYGSLSIDQEARPAFEAVSESFKRLAQQIDDALARPLE